jgi:two-component system OmpR family sensor kinase/two-component system sensor histidine kinase BaeS
MRSLGLMRSLSVKLVGAFALVILVGAAITYVVAARTLSRQFTLFVSRSRQLRAESWAPLFADYYDQAGNWVGVETVLAVLPSTSTPMGMMGQGHGRGPMYGQGEPGGQGMMRMGLEEDHILLADADGRIVLDSGGELEGQTLPADSLGLGAPVTSNDERVGTLLVVAPESGPTAALAGEFLAALNRGILLAIVVAGLVAIVLAAILVRQIIAPLHRLQSAADAIAGGDLSQRVTVTSRDEVGDVSHAFNQMAEALEHDENLRRHTMADIAHELRTPLTVIQGQVEALVDGVFPLTLEQLAPIHDETILLSRLVADLRELALAEAGQLAIERRRVDLSNLIGRVAAAVEPVAAEKDITLSVEVSPSLPPISADADRLNQVLHNLLSNALRHTPPGGKISLRAGIEGDEAREVWLEVSDTGEGIPSEQLPYVFDRFYRADPARSRGTGGTGLGLAIVRAIVEAHGGRISVASDGVPGRGSTVTLHLPTDTTTNLELNEFG